jgi:hypothetical protein
LLNKWDKVLHKMWKVYEIGTRNCCITCKFASEDEKKFFAKKNFSQMMTDCNFEPMHSSRTLSGPLLDEQYKKSLKHLNEIFESSTELSLISDGWINSRGDVFLLFHQNLWHSSKQRNSLMASISSSRICWTLLRTQQP